MQIRILSVVGRGECNDIFTLLLSAALAISAAERYHSFLAHTLFTVDIYICNTELAIRMLKLAMALFVLAAPMTAAPIHLRTNALEDPLGIDTPHPTFSWQSDAKTPNWMQCGYEILVATDVKNLAPNKADVWDSGRINSSESVDIAYAGAAIRSQQRYSHPYYWAAFSVFGKV